MTKELSLDLVQSQLKPQQKLTVTQETLDEINQLASNPDYGPEFLDSYLDHLNIFKDNPKRSHTQYLSAIKFFSLVESGNSLTDSYIKTFPDRFDARKQNYPFDERDKSIMRGEASRYNNSMLVNEIRKVASIPVQLIHRHILHEAIIEQAYLMRSAKSEMVRQKAGATLITELKPQEDHVLSVKVDDNTESIIDELRKAAEKLTIAEFQSVNAGVPLKDIADSVIVTVEADVLNDGEPVADTEVIDDVATVVPGKTAVTVEEDHGEAGNSSLVFKKKPEISNDETVSVKPEHIGRWSI